ncbi:2-hydroxyacid dehydrogenase [Clostridium polynesiense]|uniref:2-hydroxyacid dehydrogenase n=1 Tax=Clostridium polynesiense TaxID=1325933 RepID=UPI000590E5FA|nr:2-hydroxyacid dehydrogenase [Clostridium polynesiense]
MNIVLLEPLAVSEEVLKELTADLNKAGHVFTKYDTVEKDESILKERVKDADILIIANNPLSGEVIRAAKNLKYISVAFTGVDHIDKEACLERGIKVSNAAGYSNDSVAELTLGLIISVLRNILPCDEATRKFGTKEGLVGFELKGKTVGIIGTGAIGLRVAEILKAFNCRILGYSRSKRQRAEELGVEYVTLEELLKNSDIVTLHTPLNEETKGLINEERIGLMKESSILINLSRGPVVDSMALAEALNNEKIAGAAVDVYETEPPIDRKHPLLNSKNTIVTPHIAYATRESMVNRAKITIENVYAYLNNEEKNRVF